MTATDDRPLAAAGLDSYRHRSRWGWIMIGASSVEDALREAKRSMETGEPALVDLQRWDGDAYVDVVPDGRARALFDAMPHRHPRGAIPDWDRQPERLRDVFRRKADATC